MTEEEWNRIVDRPGDESINEYDRDEIIAAYTAGISPLQLALEYEVDITLIERILEIHVGKGDVS